MDPSPPRLRPILDTASKKVHTPVMRSLPATAAVVAILVAALGARELLRKPMPSPRNGQLSGQTYSNAFFGFTLTVPATLPLADRAALEKGIHENLPRPRRIHLPNSFRSLTIPDMLPHLLLSLGSNPGAARDLPWIMMTPTNTAFVVTAQNFGQDRTVNDGRFILEFWHSILAVNRVSRTPRAPEELSADGVAEASVGGRTFFRETFHLATPGSAMVYRIYARNENGYALQFMLAAPTDAGLDELEKVLATARFH